MHNVKEDLLEELISLRKQLHLNPELSGQEIQTARRVVAYLKDCNPSEIIERVGGFGVVAIFDSGKPGPSIMFRADLDALPIQEVNTFAHSSKTEGVSHKCGHDGHTCVVLGLAGMLSDNPPKRGKVVLLFQPAEEDGMGAKAVLSDPRFQAIRPDYIFAFHNLPGYPLHQVVLRRGSFTSAVKSIIIKLKGKTAHAAEPEFGINPALPISEILQYAALLSNNEPERADFTLITPVHIAMGEIAYGISAGHGELRLTIRSWTQQQMDELAQQLVVGIQQIAEKHGIEITYSWTHEFSANKNNDQAIDMLETAAGELALDVLHRSTPFKWGEDFGLFTQHYNGAMFGIGSGEKCPALHNPDYDFPDEIMATGILMFHQISLTLLK